MPPDLEIVREWLIKARNDLRTAQLALDADPPVLDTACFHCQQAAEKALKGFLEWHEITSPKVHDLGRLLDLCDPLQPAFARLRPDILALSLYAVTVRYPSAPEPTAEDGRAAFAAAQELFQCVIERLPLEVRP